ncbi:MAG: sigma-70 family RNA polymerase sigma factor [Solirubrobacteraceae bacterium]
MRGSTPLLRLQSDERLIALVRRGNHGAFEALVARYQSRLLAFCRHMLGSREDAEDILQEVFAASFNAILADDRPINVRPWLYRIARNRSLNHLRRVQAIGVDSMDVHLSEGGVTTADKVHKREEFRLLVADVQELPESQRTALLLREIDALSYEQIAEAMETTIPSVKSLLVRARVSLAEASEARHLSCEEVRDELGEVSEGLRRSTAPARRHLRTCERCQGFRSQLRSTNRALTAVFPVAPLLLVKKALLAQFGMTASAGAGGAAGAAAATVAVGGGTSAMSAGISTIATKTAAGLAAAAIVTAGAVEVKHVQTKLPAAPATSTAKSPAPEPATSEPEVVAAAQQPSSPAKPKPKPKPKVRAAAVQPPAVVDREKTKPAEKKTEPEAASQTTAGTAGASEAGAGDSGSTDRPAAQRPDADSPAAAPSTGGVKAPAAPASTTPGSPAASLATTAGPAAVSSSGTAGTAPATKTAAPAGHAPTGGATVKPRVNVKRLKRLARRRADRLKSRLREGLGG